jgi:hypothetical protein
MVGTVMASERGIVCRRALSQEFFHNQDINPSTVQLTLFVIHADGGESEPFVERETGLIEGEGRQHQFMIAKRWCGGDELLEKASSDATPAPAAFHIYRKVGHGIIDGPWIKEIEASPTYDPAQHFGDDDGMSRPPSCQPLAALLRGARLGLQRGNTILNALVIDRPCSLPTTLSPSTWQYDPQCPGYRSCISPPHRRWSRDEAQWYPWRASSAWIEQR